MPNQTFRIDLDDGHHIVGDHIAGTTPGYLFLHGLGSTRLGEKSDSLMAWAAARGRAFTRIDFRGHGDSSGTIGQIMIGELIADVTLLLERFGPVVLVGSSLGGVVGAFATAQRRDLVTGLGLIAPALGFMHRLERSTDDQGRMWTTDGRSFVLHQHVIADAKALDERGLPRQLDVPTLVVHGDADEVVSHTRSRRFFAGLPHASKELWVVPDGDHRLSTVTGSIWERLDRLVG